MRECSKALPFPVASGAVWILLVTLLTAGLHARLWDGELPSDFSPGSQVRSDAEAAGIPVIAREEMKARVEAGSHVILDARPRDQYASSHIPTAMSLPVSDYEMGMAELGGFLEPSMPLVLYCTGPDCDEALRLAIRLREDGFLDLTVFVGGMKEWEAVP